MSTAAFDDFQKVDMRVGRIIEVHDFPEAKTPAFKLVIDFGDLGVKKSSAQIVDLYSKQDLERRLVVAVVNFPPKQVGPFVSEVLTLGTYDDKNRVVLLDPGQDAQVGSRIS